MASDIAALCDLLESDRAVVFGHSAGGFVAMQLALRDPKLVQGLILCSTSPIVRLLPEDGDEEAPSLASRADPEVMAVANRVFGL